MVDRLDEERLEILRGWGAGLASDRREELRAAGKAITVLIDEIDRLQVDLWNARVEQRQADRRALPEAPGIDEALLGRLADFEAQPALGLRPSPAGIAVEGPEQAPGG
jgi:hypothetical protein